MPWAQTDPMTERRALRLDAPLPVHHVVARAKGGKSTVDDIKFYCWGHNDVAAREDFGHEVMDRYSSRTPKQRVHTS